MGRPMNPKTKKKIEAMAGGTMTDYQKARDEAAEKYSPNNYDEQSGFIAGSDWATARAEKRIQELEDQLAISHCDDLSECVAGCRYFSYRESVHHKDCGIYEQSLTKINADKLQSLEQRCKGLVEAIKQISKYEAYNGDTWPADIAREALKAYSEGEK